MDNSNNHKLTFEEAVNAISKPQNGGFDPREEKLKKTAKEDTGNRISPMGLFGNR